MLEKVGADIKKGAEYYATPFEIELRRNA